MKRKYLLSVVLVLILFSAIAFFGYDRTKPEAMAASGINNDIKFTYKIIAGLDGTFGYDIYTNGKLLIHQETIPSIPGKNGFSSLARAEKTALSVIRKLKMNQNPPVVTRNELKAMEVID
jgi:hypothetical protein